MQKTDKMELIMELLRDFKKISKDDVMLAGGKGVSLGEMTKVGIPVPPGFVILAAAFEKFLEETDLNVEIDSILDSVNHKEIHTVENASEKIKALILQAEIPQDIALEIQKFFKNLNSKYVAVRSSATAEDSASAAWAGQLESYLNTVEENLLENVKKCWTSLFTPRAIFYRFEKDLHKQKISVAVVVQKMVENEKSGITFSVHPVTQDRNQLIIEAGFGLGEAIVSGQITPDSYVVEKQPRRIIDKNIQTQSKGLYRAENGGNEWCNIPKEQGEKQVLSDSEILKLSEIILQIENHYGFPCDIEWAFEKGKFYIIQSRPITTLTTDNIPRKSDDEYELTFSRECFVPTLQVWYVSENEKFSKYIQYQFPKTGYMFFEYIHGLARNYIAMSSIKSAYNFALSKTLNDGGYFARIEKSFWNYLESIEPYVAGNKDIQTKEELKTFFDNVAEVWGAYTIGYWFTYYQNQNMPKDVFQRSEKIRLANETIIEDCNKIFSKGLQNIFSKNYTDDYKYLTVEEIISGKIPPKNILKQRSRYIIYANGIQYYESLDIFLRKENKYLEKVQYSEKEGLRGQVAYRGRIRGVAKICLTSKEMEKVQEGDVLVSAMTTPNFLPAIKLSSAIVTDEGGVTCHAAIVARELRKPCIIGTKIATKILKDGNLIEVDADNGVIKILK